MTIGIVFAKKYSQTDAQRIKAAEKDLKLEIGDYPLSLKKFEEVIHC